MVILSRKPKEHNYPLKMRTPTLKTHNFASKIKSKSGVTSGTLFYLGLKVQPFATIASKAHNVVKKPLK
jgi:hypothetical protein